MSPFISRRQFGQLALAGVASSATLRSTAFGAGRITSEVAGLRIGIEAYSLRGLHYEDLIVAMQQLGIGECEVNGGSVEPKATDVPDRAAWRATAPMSYYEDIRKKFEDAGLHIRSYYAGFGAGPGRGARGANGAAAAPPPPPPPVTDEQIDRVFDAAKALGAKNVSSPVSLDMARRVAPFAAKHNMTVAIAVSDPDVLTQGVALSPNFLMDLDIGDFAHSGRDPLPFVKDNYTHLFDIHLKDCKLNGPSVPFGEGDSHMKEVLQFLRDKKSQALINIDCDYPGTGTSVEEVKKCLDYVKACLA